MAEQDQEPEGEEEGSTLRKRLQEEVGEKRKLEHQVAFMKVGIDPESSQARIISNNMGDLEFTPENITQTLNDVQESFGTPEPPPAAEPEEDPEAERQRAIAAQGARRDISGQGGDPMPEPPERDKVAAAWEQRQTDLKNGINSEIANSQIASSIIEDAIANGNDSPFVWEGHDENERKQSQRVL